MRFIAAHLVSLEWAGYDNVFIFGRTWSAWGAAAGIQGEWGRGHGGGRFLERDQLYLPRFYIRPQVPVFAS
jgi:hypothetical protein